MSVFPICLLNRRTTKKVPPVRLWHYPFMKKHKHAIVFRDGTEAPCTKDMLDKYLTMLNLNTVSCFSSKKEALNYVAEELFRKKKILITKGYKHSNIYDVWFNE